MFSVFKAKLHSISRACVNSAHPSPSPLGNSPNIAMANLQRQHFLTELGLQVTRWNAPCPYPFNSDNYSHVREDWSMHHALRSYIPDVNPGYHFFLPIWWGRDDYFYLSFLPRNLNLNADPILHCLSDAFRIGSRGRYQPIIEKVPGGYRLQESYVKQWTELENHLHHLYMALKRGREQWMPLLCKPPRRPNHIGYQEPAETRGDAAGRIFAARREFLAMACWVTMFLAKIDHNKPNPDTQNWIKALADYNIPRYLVDALRRSPFFTDFSGTTVRQGMIIDMAIEWSFCAGNMSYMFEFANVPIWYFYHTENMFKRHPYQLANVLLPRPSDIQRLQVTKKYVQFNDICDVKFDALSKQQPSETIHEFLQRRHDSQEKMARDEPPSALQRRQNRTQSHTSNLGTWLRLRSKVYEWQPVPYPPYHFRTIIHEADADDVFNSFAGGQVIYNAWDDCFDLCKDLDPTAVPLAGLNAYDDDDDEEDETYHGMQPLGPAFDIGHYDPPEGLAPDNALTFTQPAAEGVLIDNQFQLAWTIHNLPNLQTTLQGRYGLQQFVSLEPHEQAPLTYTLKDALTPFVERSEDEMVTLTAEFSEVVCAFAYILCLNNTNIDIVTPKLSDILFSTKVFVRKVNRGLFVPPNPVQVIPKPPITRGQPIRRDGDADRKIWFIFPHEYRNGEPYIGVNSVITYKQVFREQWGPSLEEIGKEMTRRGIPFMLVWSDQKVPRRIPIIPPLSTTMRPANFVYSASDYLAYINQRLNLFRHLPLAKTALRQGGIIWRLALESFEVGAQPPSSVAGGLNEHISNAFSFQLPVGRFMENILTDDEIDVICGVYTDQTDIKNQTMLRSWWPLPTVWSTCGLNTGYWTRECETWFQKHLLKILTGGVQPLRSSEWRTSLRWHKPETAKLMRALEVD
ncbi:hypothetical protein QCA50_010070 [Cerrena zonata]|uniref:Uncharacterized protein n=1 Tax=Cerrena zonata TaxID=2478898 RepID=A0AAW0G458_9APHY